jgi:hypothetical protein
MIGRTTGVVAGLGIGLLLGASGGCVDRVIRWCPPGTEGCPCDDGSCEGDLACVADECVDPQIASCERFLDGLSCGGIDFAQTLDCSAFDPSCDLTSFLTCLDDNFVCNDGVAELGRWANCDVPPDCVELPDDTAVDASAEAGGEEPMTTSVPGTTGPVDPGPGPCAPVPDDDGCDACLKSECCAQWAACVANPVCECLMVCVDQMGLEGLPACQSECDSEGSLPVEALPLQGCQTTNCSSACAD